MSQICYEYVELQELVVDSDYIVIASKQDPFEEHQKIPIGKNKEKHPDFIKVYYNFKVEKILYASREEIPEDISVVQANWSIELEEHKLYYLKGVAESPIYIAYEPGVDIYKAERVILFLNRVTNEDGVFIFSIEFAYESVEQEQQVMDLINKLKLKEET